MSIFRRISRIIAKIFIRGNNHCCHCSKYNVSPGVCSVHFLHNRKVFFLRVSPWDPCMLADLREEIEIADMDSLHAQRSSDKEYDKEIKEEEKKDEENKEGK